MDFNFTEEQQMLRDSIQKFVREHYPADKVGARRKAFRKAPGFAEDNWQQFADLGWLGVPFPEELGGIGGDLTDVMVVMEELGRGLVVEPYFPTVVLFGSALMLGGNADQQQSLVPQLIEGKLKGTLAYMEEQARYELADVATTATAREGKYLLNGVKSLALNADSADYLVVSARTAGERTDRDGITLFLVPADAEGVKRVDYPTIDVLRASEVSFENVAVGEDAILGERGKGLALLEAISQRAILALGAESVGMMEMLYRDTTDYTSQRVQFEKPLAAFQSVKHRIVDMFVQTELTRSLLYRATMEVQGEHEEAPLDVHGLKHMVGKAGRFVGQSAVQLHGGMGQTEELRVGHYFIRLAAIDAQFGDTDYHLGRYTELMPIPEGEPDADMLPF